MKTCTNCKAEFSTDGKFCPECGTLVETEEVSTKVEEKNIDTVIETEKTEEVVEDMVWETMQVANLPDNTFHINGKKPHESTLEGWEPPKSIPVAVSHEAREKGKRSLEGIVVLLVGVIVIAIVVLILVLLAKLGK